MMKKILIAFALFMLPVVCEATPIIYFSDLVDGPTTGFDGSASKGAAISIWGTGFGTSGTITVGGQTLSSSDSNQVVEWAATTNPTTARGLQRITFYLNSSMTTGGAAPNTTIKVTVGGLDSNTIPFHCRALGSNHIYFASPAGSDSNNGQTTSTPWLTGKHIRLSIVAGDIVYLRGGTYTTPDDCYQADTSRSSWMTLWNGSSSCTFQSGTSYNSVGIISYPGEVAQMGNGNLYTSANPVFEIVFDRLVSSTGWAFNYWTISKLTTLTPRGIYSENNGAPNNSDTNLRIIGNDIRTTSAAKYTGMSLSKDGGGSGSGLGSTYFYVLGNYFHQIGVPLAPVTAPTLTVGSGAGLTGTYNAKYTYVSFEGSSDCDNNQPLSPGYCLYQETEMSDAGASVTLSNGALRISWGAPPVSYQQSSNRVFDAVRIYRTKAGGSTYYFDQQIPAVYTGGTFPTETYIDSTTPDNSLSSQTDIAGGYYVEAMYFQGYGQAGMTHHYVMYNELARINGGGFQLYGHANGDWVDDFHFAYNYIHDTARTDWNHRPMVFGGGDPNAVEYCLVRHLYVYNNLFANNGGSNFRIDVASTSGSGGHFYIYNNTFYRDNYYNGVQRTGGSAFQMGGFRVGTGDGHEQGTIDLRNNIIYSQNSGDYIGSYNYTLGRGGTNNLWYGLGTNGCKNISNCSPFTTSADIDNNTLPGFSVSSPSAINDFNLSSSSAAKDSGVSTSAVLSNDFILTTRPHGLAYDIGAFEYTGGLPAYPSPPRNMR